MPAAWDQNVWNGTLYALPIQIDPNFGLVWNKTLFAEVGLDRVPPQTVQEFDEYFRILTKIGPDGIATSIGMVNWSAAGGHHNTIYTVGLAFRRRVFTTMMRERRQPTTPVYCKLLVFDSSNGSSMSLCTPA